MMFSMCPVLIHSFEEEPWDVMSQDLDGWKYTCTFCIVNFPLQFACGWNNKKKKKSKQSSWKTRSLVFTWNAGIFTFWDSSLSPSTQRFNIFAPASLRLVTGPSEEKAIYVEIIWYIIYFAWLSRPHQMLGVNLKVTQIGTTQSTWSKRLSYWKV